MTLFDALQYFLALMVVLGLIAGLAWAVKRVGVLPGLPTARAKGERRLTVVESLSIDTRRRLLLVRRDGAEHLLFLGPENDLVVESGIAAPQENAERSGG